MFDLKKVKKNQFKAKANRSRKPKLRKGPIDFKRENTQIEEQKSTQKCRLYAKIDTHRKDG